MSDIRRMRLLATATALALLTAQADAQVLLPPAPLTQWQTNMINFATVGYYIFGCKKMDHLEYAYSVERGYRGLSASYRDRKDAADIVNAKAAAVGHDKFCAQADQDPDLQAVFNRIKARGQ